MGRERRKTRGRLRRGQKKNGEKQAGEEEERSSRPASGRVGAYGAASPAGDDCGPKASLRSRALTQLERLREGPTIRMAVPEHVPAEAVGSPEAADDAGC